MKVNKKIYAILILPMLLTACIEEKFEPEQKPAGQVVFSNEINPMVWSEGQTAQKLPPLATKSLIDAATTSHLQTQFLRIDEYENSEGNGTYEYPTWDNGYLVEASVISSPSNQSQGYKRTVYLNPIQGYRISVAPKAGSTTDADTTFFHTRMLSWYPITCPLQKNDKGGAAVTQFNYYKKANVGYDAYTVKGNDIQLNFRNLDGRTDVMVSEVREAQHWHHPTDPHKHPSDYMPGDANMTGESIYRQPFGSNETSPIYDNCFQYKHYLSAIKVYAYAEDSEQSSAMWGKIRHVEVKNQPKSCSVTIPALTTKGRVWGTAEYSQTDLTTFELEKSHIFQGDSNADGEEIAPDNPSLDGTSSSNKLYLGYSLVAPDRDVVLQVHTDAGIYNITVPKEYKTYDKDGTLLSTETIFQDGYIYNIILNFGTEGSISAILLKDAEGVYYDLTTGQTYGDDQNQIFKYKVANSYIVDPRTTYKDKSGVEHYYDGYVFLANVIGNGNEGLRAEFPHKSTTIKPVTAGIIWESKLGLITNVKFLYDYIRFKVQPPKTKGGTFDEGNAVIGAYDEEGKLLWSWHIWVTDQPEIREYVVGQQTLAIMDRNLGATEPNPNVNALDSYGLYYQWGRKDPSMPPPSENYRPLSTATAPYYDYYGNELRSTEVANIAKPTVFDAVDNPMYIILPTEIPEFYAYDWLNRRINTLWGSEEQNQKTIYDPCPHGYRVPGTEMRTLLKTEFDKGTGAESRSFKITAIDTKNSNKPLYFPLAGYKGVDRGMSSLTAAWKYVGEKGDYMYKNIHPNGHRDRIYLSKDTNWRETGAANNDSGVGSAGYDYNGQVHTDFTNRRTAASVRCIRDDELQFSGLVYPYIHSDEFLFLGHNKDMSYGAEAKGSPLKHILFTVNFSDNETPFYTNEPSGVTGANFDATYPLPGKNKEDGSKDYDAIGEYTFRVKATNEMGNVNSTQQTVGVIDLTEIYDVKIGDQDPAKATFVTGDEKLVSFRLNMREPLSETGGINKTTKKDYELIRKYTNVYINDQWVQANYDPATGVFTTKEPVALNGDLRLQCKAKDSNVLLKQYVMSASETYEYKRLSSVTEIVNGKYYGFSTDQATPENEMHVWWWYHNGGTNVLSVGNPKDQVLHSNNLFKFEEVMDKENRAGYLQLYSTKEYVEKHFSTGTKYYFNFKNSTNGGIRVYRDVEDGYYSHHWGVIMNGSRFTWGISRTMDDATQWYMYEITPKLQYSAPVETVL